MCKIVECQACTLADNVWREARFLLNVLEIIIRFGKLFPYAVKLTQNAHLHLLGSLVGKGYGKDVAIALGILYKQSDIFGGKCESLSASCTCFIYCEWFY